MKKIALLLVAAFLWTAAPAHAGCGACEGDRKGSHAGDMVDKKMMMMTEELGLSDEQAKAVEAIMKEKMAKKKAIKEKKHEDMHALKEEFSGKVKAVLDDEQKAKFDAMMKEKMDKGSKKCCGTDGECCKGAKGSGHDHDHDHHHKGSHMHKGSH